MNTATSHTLFSVSVFCLFSFGGCHPAAADVRAPDPSNSAPASQPAKKETNQAVRLDSKKGNYAIFAGGCFWCMESAFEKEEGVLSAVSGYTGGSKTQPSYGDVSSGQTDHVEAVLVTYDEKKLTYEELLDRFWRSIDPTQADGQFADRGPHYVTVIYYLDDDQKKKAQASKRKLAASNQFSSPIVTKLEAASPFWRAEEYHQDYYKKHPFKYRRYFIGSGRKRFLDKTWGPAK